MKVAIVYDRVNKFGGAERVLLSLHKIFPDAPLYTSVYDEKKATWAKDFPRVYTSFLQQIPFARSNHEFLLFLMPYTFSKFNFDNYDLVISVTSEFAKNINVKGKHVCYCLTPTRYLWSGYDEYFQNKYLKLLIQPLIKYLRKVDLEASKKADEMIAISSEVKERIKKYYKRNTKIIFPPVSFVANTKVLRKNASYYLVVSRLVKYKKIELVVKVFNDLKLPLVIVGSGREEKYLKSIANKNINFLGNISDKELSKVYKGARALIFPQIEDFGITAVEAQVFGVPVIAYKKGGALDTVNKKSGQFFDKQTKESLTNAIKSFQKKKFNKADIKNNAKKFSEQRFREEFLQFVKNI